MKTVWTAVRGDFWPEHAWMHRKGIFVCFALGYTAPSERRGRREWSPAAGAAHPNHRGALQPSSDPTSVQDSQKGSIKFAESERDEGVRGKEGGAWRGREGERERTADSPPSICTLSTSSCYNVWQLFAESWQEASMLELICSRVPSDSGAWINIRVQTSPYWHVHVIFEYDFLGKRKALQKLWYSYLAPSQGKCCFHNNIRFLFTVSLCSVAPTPQFYFINQKRGQNEKH